VKILVFGAVLAVFLTLSTGDNATEASHAGGMDAMAIDMDPSGNGNAVVGSAGEGDELDANCANGTDDDDLNDPGPGGVINDGCPVVGSIDACARVNENDILDADEDTVADQLRVDVIAQVIPTSNRMIGWATNLDYDSSLLEIAAFDANWYIVARPGGALLNPSDVTPDSDGTFGMAVADSGLIPGSSEAGSGVLGRLDIESVAAGPELTSLTLPADGLTGHVDTGNVIQTPDALLDGLVAVDTPCPVLLIVDTSSDASLTACTGAPGDCSLRGAITNANTFPGTDAISFAIGVGPQSIMPLSALPAITEGVVISGLTQPGCGSPPCITLYGGPAGPGVVGLSLTSAGSTVSSLEVTGFGGNGISVAGSNNIITGSTISLNGGAGVAISSGTGNTVSGNSIWGNTGLGIDLGTTGVTANDIPGYPAIPDTDSGANDLQNFPEITSVLNKGGSSTVVAGRLDSTPETIHTYSAYHDTTCDGSLHGEGGNLTGSSTGPELNMDGIGSASMLLPTAIPVGNWVTQTATSPGGSTSEFSACVQVVGDTDNDGVQDAIDPGGTGTFNRGGDTFGSITTTGGLSLSIVEDSVPEGVIVAAVGTGTTAELDVCGFPDPLELTAGDVVDVDCGSAKFQTKVGPVFFRIGTIATEMPPDTTTTLTVISGVVNVTVDPGSLQPVITGGLVIFPGQTVPVEDIDFDGLVGQVDTDDDGDLVADDAETACGSDPLDITPPLSRPERIDGEFAGVDDDGNEGSDETLPDGTEAFDCDGDGYTRAAEDHVYSYTSLGPPVMPQFNGDQQTCQEYDELFPNPNTDVRPSARWPGDLNKSLGPPDSFNQISLLDLTTLLAPIRYFGTDVGTNPSDVRFDLVPGPGQFLEDINIEDLVALLAGGAGFPPMFNYSRAFGAGACPYAGTP
jgi:hypothetical protein